MYFKSEYSFNNMTYSIDMLRLKTYIDYDKFKNIEFYFRTYHADLIDKYWISDRIMQFKYNYRIVLEEGRSFYFSFHHNNEKAEEHYGLHNFTIEFNPNKIKDDLILLHILNISGDWYIKSFDLAVDIKCNVRDIIFDKGRKRKVHMFSNGGDDLTYTIGEGDCRLKLYNKKKESKLDIVGDLTRIEISRVLDDFPITDIKFFKYKEEYFPELYLNNYVYSISDIKDKTLLPILYAVQSGYPINDLSRRYKEKIKKLFEGGNKIRFTQKEATNVLLQTIYVYFMNNKLVKWR